MSTVKKLNAEQATAEVKRELENAGWRCGYHFMLTEFSKFELIDSLARALREAQRRSRQHDIEFDEGEAINDFKEGYERSLGKEMSHLAWTF